MKYQLWIFILMNILLGCKGPRNEAVFSETRISTPTSYVSLDVNLPVSELKDLINEKLPVQLLDKQGIRLKKKSDTLFLSLSRYGTVDMAYRQGILYISMPLNVSAVIKKKVMGFTLTNDGQPLTFRAIAQVAADVGLTNSWDFQFDCQWKGMDWEEAPVFNLLGLELDLSQFIDELLTENAGRIETIICSKVNEEVDFRETVEKIYYDIQKPNRIAKRPFELYLSTEGRGIRGQLIRDKKDTLSMHVELQSLVHIKPHSLKEIDSFDHLPLRSDPINSGSSLSVFAEMFIRHGELKSKVNQLIEKEQFEYKGYRLSVLADSIFSNQGRLNLLFSISGDINGLLSLVGRPSISKDLTVSFTSFEYEILKVEEDWVSATDLAFHKALETYLEDLLQVETFGFFDQLDTKARKGIKKSKLGEKLDILLQFDQISPYENRVTQEGIQVILQVDGSASVELTKNVLVKKGR